MKSFTHGKIKPAKIVALCIVGAIVLFIVIALGTLLVKKYIKKDPVPMFAGYACMIVASPSMTGTINEGDMVIVRRSSEFKLGDIVTYVTTDTNEAVTHRIVNYGDGEGMFVTKGDFNNTQDMVQISIDQIAGKVVTVIPKVGLAVKWFLYEGGIVYVVAIIAIIAVGVYFYNSFKKDSEEEEEEESPPDDSGESETKEQSPADGSGESETKEQSPADGSGEPEIKEQSSPDGSGEPETKEQSPADGSGEPEIKEQSSPDGSGESETKEQSSPDGSGESETKNS